jgi:two-component system, LytTR family, response regulator
MSASSTSIILPFVGHREVVPLNEIVSLQGLRNYTEFTFSTGRTTLLAAITLKRYKERLATTAQFFRISKSVIVNVKFVVDYNLGMAAYVKLQDGRQFQMSRRRVLYFRNRVEVAM